ncbi:MAG: hypothetical protein COA96_18225 [SAR86 cluster bacterium]|uniref:Uncharacterized protein n=1 Tax=SAR86 cluster bacterium TaxID=2030880 RepID=A0A2A5ADD0_9GAMM|nr:MAG: hypothetical protein COA96_18225 [SAR86 cluster bacterium]
MPDVRMHNSSLVHSNIWFLQYFEYILLFTYKGLCLALMRKTQYSLVLRLNTVKTLKIRPVSGKTSIHRESSVSDNDKNRQIKVKTPMNKKPLYYAISILVSFVFLSSAYAQSYEPPRTVYGKPDLQGTWSNASITTLERNERYESLILTDDEINRATDEHPQNVRLATDDNMVAGQLPDGSDLPKGRGYNAFWIDPGTRFGNINGEHRTSWIVDPADGRIPYNEQGRARKVALRAKSSTFDGPESRPLAERCISTGLRTGPPMINGLYNNNYEIVQTADYVVLRTEMISHARVVPLNTEHKLSVYAPMFGESVGHWEGDTLVVVTTNFSPMQEEAAISLTTKGRVIERFTRVSDEQIIYEFTIDDPAYYTQPWHGELSFLATDSKVYEFACHEGNYAMSGILAGARRQEHDEQQK